MDFLLRKRILLPVLCLAILALIFSSCGSTRSFTYMQGKFDTAALSQLNTPDAVIRKEDLVSIIVFSDNPEATRIYNQPMGTGISTTATGMGGTGSSTASSAYLVDANGNIEFQGLGLLHVEGLTRSKLKDTLDARLKQFLTNPYYTIRFLNYRFTVLGEVARPGVFSIPSDHLNLLEAFALAGDLTFYARRDNILVIRENNGKREFCRLDITKPEIMASPFFNLQQNDLVIVEQTKKKVVANDQVTLRNISIASTIISTLLVFYTIFK